LLRQTYRARLGDAFKPGGDIDTVSHQIAVGFLNHVAEMDADSKLDAFVGRDLSVGSTIAL
jgi:hypothetical protein